MRKIYTKTEEGGEISGYVLLVGMIIAMLALGLTIQITGRTQAEYATLSASQSLTKQIAAECQRYYQSGNISCRFIDDIMEEEQDNCFESSGSGSIMSWSCRWDSFYEAPSQIAETLAEFDTNQTNLGSLFIELRGDSNRVTTSLNGCAVYAIYPFPRWCGTKTVSFYL